MFLLLLFQKYVDPFEFAAASNVVKAEFVKGGHLQTFDFLGTPRSMSQALGWVDGKTGKRYQIEFPGLMSGRAKIASRELALEYVRLFSCPRYGHTIGYAMGLEIVNENAMPIKWLPDWPLRLENPGSYGICGAKELKSLKWTTVSVRKLHGARFEVKRPMMKYVRGRGWMPFVVWESVGERGDYMLVRKQEIVAHSKTLKLGLPAEY